MVQLPRRGGPLHGVGSAFGRRPEVPHPAGGCVRRGERRAVRGRDRAGARLPADPQDHPSGYQAGQHTAGRGGPRPCDRLQHRDCSRRRTVGDFHVRDKTVHRSAPEIYMCSCEEYGVLGYGFAVDWWSLGILAWETLAMERPYSLHSTTSNREALRILKEGRQSPSHWGSSIRDLLDRLLTLAPSARVSCLKELKRARAMKGLDFDKVLNKQIKPAFTPPKDHLNCDPTFELEEMIIETKPLHKKKKRLAKQRSLRVDSAEDAGFADGAGSSVDTRRLAYIPEYRVYNREREIERQEREKKEKQWEEELNTAMKGAEERLKTKQQHLPAQRTGNRLSVSTTNVKARINASPRQGRRASATASSDIDFIDASPEPSTS
ncbi:uncharacterized protein [Temnothorax nylanderi]|uniref:uncharacterized protein isoform X2 n=1 Tax=Temnothorax nylanderi TaxID=102681 RepID=UPI003A895C09